MTPQERKASSKAKRKLRARHSANGLCDTCDQPVAINRIGKPAKKCKKHLGMDADRKRSMKIGGQRAYALRWGEPRERHYILEWR